MQPWARKFYLSKAWQQCRDAYYNYRYGLCEQCGGAGLIVHHKTALTTQNINDASVTIDWDKLELLCLDCHNRAHGAASAAAGLLFNEQGELVQCCPPHAKKNNRTLDTEGVSSKTPE